MAYSPTTPGAVFISYSHQDATYLVRLQRYLAPYARSGAISLWDDTQIRPGDDWKRSIEQALSSARVALLLVSVDFLASEFVTKEELPRLLAAAEARGTRILPVILTPCLFRRTALSHFQAINDPLQPLSGIPQHEQDLVWERVVEAVLDTLDASMGESNTSKLLHSPPALTSVNNPIPLLPNPSSQPVITQMKPPAVLVSAAERIANENADGTIRPVVELIPKQKPTTLPTYRSWWVVVACPQDGDEENLKTWRVVYVSSNNASTWEKILQEAQPYLAGAKDVKVLTRHQATKNMTVNRKLRRFFDGLKWEHPFAEDVRRECAAHGWPDPRYDVGKA